MVDVVTRTSKGYALTRAEIDKNLESLRRVWLCGGLNTTNHGAGWYFCMGAGASNHPGQCMSHAGKVIAISLATRGLANGETLTVRLSKNDTEQGATRELSLTGATGVALKSTSLILATPVTVAVNDLLNFYTQACPATLTNLYSNVGILVELNY